MASRKSSEDHEKALFDPPADISRHILSLLSMKEAAKASLISKAYLQAWRERPNLDLDLGFFKLRDKQKLVDFVNSTMQWYQGKENLVIQSFKLRGFFYDVPVSVIQGWIETALENSVLKMDLYVDSVHYSFKFPQKILEAKSLTDLFLSNGKLEKQAVGKSLTWHNLRSLSLRGVTVDDEMLQSIISCCQLLEYLKIDNCQDLTGIKVKHHKNLKELRIVPLFGSDQSVEIAAPSLEIFFLHDGWMSFQRLVCLIYVDVNISKIDLDVPSIEFFAYRGIMLDLSFTSPPSGRWASELDLLIYVADASWFLGLKKLLTKLNQSDALLSICYTNGTTFNIDDTIDFPEFPIPEIESVVFKSVVPNTLILNLCPFRDHDSCTKRFITFLIEKLILGKDRENDGMQEISFWHRDLKEVKVEVFKVTKDKLHQEPLDLKELWKSSSSLNKKRRFCFSLEWAKSNKEPSKWRSY